MARKAIAAAVLLLALVPAARLAWMAREMPHFGHLHDDSIYFVAAKSMAEGRGYRILSLPGEPFQTKYPPLWPLALAAIWKIDPRFPENLRWGMALAWVMLPAFMVLAWCWFRPVGFGPAMRTTLCAVLVLSPWVVFLSTTLMSELIFSVALMAALLALERAKTSPWLALAAGLLGASAYLIQNGRPAVAGRRPAVADLAAPIPKRGRLFLRDAPGRRGVDVLGRPSHDRRARYRVALLHQLSRLPDLQHRLA